MGSWEPVHGYWTSSFAMTCKGGIRELGCAGAYYYLVKERFEIWYFSYISLYILHSCHGCCSKLYSIRWSMCGSDFG